MIAVKLGSWPLVSLTVWYGRSGGMLNVDDDNKFVWRQPNAEAEASGVRDKRLVDDAAACARSYVVHMHSKHNSYANFKLNPFRLYARVLFIDLYTYTVTAAFTKL